MGRRGPQALPLSTRFFRYVSLGHPGGCWIWTGSTQTSGYGLLGTKHGKPCEGAHRVAYSLFVGELPKGAFVLHKCDVKLCVNPEHLFLGTHAINMQDMTSKLRQPYGQRHYNAKLSYLDVEDLRRLYSDGTWTTLRLAQKFGVGQAQISRIVSLKQRKLG